MFVNHGMLRKGRAREMVESRSSFNVPLIHVHAEGAMQSFWLSVTEPEMKRRLIGTEFWKVTRLRSWTTFSSGTGYLTLLSPALVRPAARLTSEPPQPDSEAHFDLIEPLDHFFKDEVRAGCFSWSARTLSTDSLSQVLALLSHYW